jgi:hypothetical protein
MTTNETTLLIVVLLIVAAALTFWYMMRQRRTHALRERFGDEYDRTVATHDGRGKAEAALEERQKRVAALEIRPLTREERVRFTDEWTDVKAVFVDSPAEAVLHADRLVAKMMQTRGYPMADFERRFEDLSVDHGEVARHYREGHALAMRHEHGGGATTEDLRQAMRHYEALFDDLVRDSEGDESRLHVASRN